MTVVVRRDRFDPNMLNPVEKGLRSKRTLSRDAKSAQRRLARSPATGRFISGRDDTKGKKK